MVSSTFNQQYHLSEYDFATHHDNDIRVVSLSVSTEIFSGSQGQFIDHLIDYLEIIPYEASVLSVGETNGYEEAVDTLYVKVNPDAYSHLLINDSYPDSTLSNNDRQLIMTNYDENYVRVIQPYRFDRVIRYDGVKNKIDYKTLGAMKEMVENNGDFIINLNFFVPEGKDFEFKNTLRTDFFDQHFNCVENSSPEQVCGLNIHTRTPLDIRNFEWKLLNENVGYPTLIMLVSCISLISIIIFQEIKNKKEIIIRKMHGNSENIIFLRLLFPLIIQTILIFLFSLILLFVICYEGPFYLLKNLLFVLLKVSMIFSLIIVFLMSLLMLTQKLMRKGLYLKGESQISSIYIGNIILKTIVIVFLSIPLITHGEHVLKRYSYQREMSQITENFDQVVSSVNYGYEFSREDEERMNKQLFNYATEFEIAYINFTDIMRNFENPKFPTPIEINTVAFKILFPEIHEEFSGKEFVEIIAKSNDNQIVSSDSIPVEKTPQVTTPFYTWGVLENPTYKLILNPNEDDLDMINFMSLFSTKKDNQNFGDFVDEVSNHITRPEFLKLQTLQSRSQKEFTKTATQFGMKIVVVLLLTYVYSNLLGELFLSNNGKAMTVRYLHGMSRVERYSKIYIYHSLSVFVSCIITMFFLIKENSGTSLVSVRFICLYFLIVLIFDLVLVSYQLHKFEKNSIVLILKGEQ